MLEYIFAFVVGAMLLFVVIALLAKPLKWAFKVVINSALGCLLLMLFNLVGKMWGLHIGVNAITALVVGVLGLPGFAMLLLMQVIMG